MAAESEERFPVGTLVRQDEYGDSVFEVVGFWRGQLRLRSDLDTTHVASASSLVTVESLVGKKYRSPDGGHPMIVSREEGRFVYVKRGDSSKRSLASPFPGYLLSRRELLADWTEVA